MRKLWAAGLLFLPIIHQAQNIDYNKIVIPDRAVNIEFREKLVQIAWKNHPANAIALRNVATSRKLKNEAKLSWLSDIYAVGNLNEFTLNPDPLEQRQSQFFPRYNFGVRLSLGTFALTPIRTRIANDLVKVSELEVNERKLEVRNLILTGVEKLEEQYQVLRIKSWLKEDFLILYKDAEQKFSQGQMPIAQYQSAVQAYYGRVEEVVIAQSNFNQQQLALEALLGLPLGEIEGYTEFLAEIDLKTKRTE